MLCFILSASAQDKRHDVSFSVGTLPIPYVLTDAPVTYNASYMYALNDYVSIGGTAGYTHADLTPHDEETYYETGNLFAAMGSIRTYWFRGNGCRLYSSASLGWQVQFRKESPNYNYWKDVYTYMPVDLSDKHEVVLQPAVQVSAIGLELGGETVKLFTEVGFGTQGMGQAGVRVRF